MAPNSPRTNCIRPADNEKKLKTDNKVGKVPPICLIFHQTVAVFKVSNVKRYHEASHKSFAEKCPVICELHKSKIENLHIKY